MRLPIPERVGCFSCLWGQRFLHVPSFCHSVRKKSPLNNIQLLGVPPRDQGLTDAETPLFPALEAEGVFSFLKTLSYLYPL